MVVPPCTEWHTRVVPRCTARPRRARTYCATGRRTYRAPAPRPSPARGTAPSHVAGMQTGGGSKGPSCLGCLRYVQHCSEPRAYRLSTCDCRRRPRRRSPRSPSRRDRLPPAWARRASGATGPRAAAAAHDVRRQGEAGVRATPGARATPGVRGWLTPAGWRRARDWLQAFCRTVARSWRGLKCSDIKLRSSCTLDATTARDGAMRGARSS